jgi:hypothetical protein
MVKAGIIILLVIPAVIIGGVLVTNYLDYLDHIRITVTSDNAKQIAEKWMAENVQNGELYNVTEPVLERDHRLVLYAHLVWRVQFSHMINNLAGDFFEVYVDPYNGQVIGTAGGVA